jgi:citronellol/citronellal dehydrogenase
MRASAIYRPDLLKDKVVVVTGGGTGIGQAIAAECARLGARVAIGGRKPEKLAATQALIDADGGAAASRRPWTSASPRASTPSSPR